MKNNWLSLILGLFLILFAFLGFPSDIKNKILIGVGVIVFALSFREIARKKVLSEKLEDEDEKEKESIADTE